MKLYLMQHALAFSAAQDSERALSPEGIEQAKASAQGIKRLGLKFDLIASSPKRRAKQTAALIAEIIRYPYSDILTTDALLPDVDPDDILSLMQKEPMESTIFLVGHMPHLGNVTSRLLHSNTILFEHAGLTCLEMTGPNSACLESHLQAGQLARLVF